MYLKITQTSRCGRGSRQLARIDTYSSGAIIVPLCTNTRICITFRCCNHDGITAVIVQRELHVCARVRSKTSNRTEIEHRSSTRTTPIRRCAEIDSKFGTLTRRARAFDIQSHSRISDDDLRIFARIGSATPNIDDTIAFDHRLSARVYSAALQNGSTLTRDARDDLNIFDAVRCFGSADLQMTTYVNTHAAND